MENQITMDKLSIQEGFHEKIEEATKTLLKQALDFYEDDDEENNYDSAIEKYNEAIHAANEAVKDDATEDGKLALNRFLSAVKCRIAECYHQMDNEQQNALKAAKEAAKLNHENWEAHARLAECVLQIPGVVKFADAELEIDEVEYYADKNNTCATNLIAALRDELAYRQTYEMPSMPELFGNDLRAVFVEMAKVVGILDPFSSELHARDLNPDDQGAIDRKAPHTTHGKQFKIPKRWGRELVLQCQECDYNMEGKVRNYSDGEDQEEEDPVYNRFGNYKRKTPHLQNECCIGKGKHSGRFEFMAWDFRRFRTTAEDRTASVLAFKVEAKAAKVKRVAARKAKAARKLERQTVREAKAAAAAAAGEEQEEEQCDEEDGDDYYYDCAAKEASDSDGEGESGHNSGNSENITDSYKDSEDFGVGGSSPGDQTHMENVLKECNYEYRKIFEKCPNAFRWTCCGRYYSWGVHGCENYGSRSGCCDCNYCQYHNRKSKKKFIPTQANRFLTFSGLFKLCEADTIRGIPWSTANHKYMTKQLKDTVFFVLLCHNKVGSGSKFCDLPKELLLNVFNLLH